ncbi:MAG: PaaI family thioesterase [Proteobacteria bacterium]|nr:PaaI family thioesterase [Pseudomonadota bacterium]
MLDFGADIPFVKELGFALHRMHGGESELRYVARPEHTNSYGVMHGGAVMTLLDVAMATAARSDTPDMGVVTIEMKSSFMRPARGPMVARGRLIQRTRSIAFAEAWVHDAEGRLCSQSTGTFKYVPKAQPGAGQGSISTD